MGCKRAPQEEVFRDAADGLDKNRRAAAALGLPTDPDKFDPINLAGKENAAPIYAEALGKWRGILASRHAWATATDRVSRGVATQRELDLYAKARPELDPIYGDLKRATAIPQMDRNLAYGAINFSQDLDHEGFYGMTQIVGAEALDGATQGDAGRVLTALNVLQRMASHVVDEPRLAGLLSQVSLTRNYVRTALACLQATNGSPDMVTAIEKTKPSRTTFDFKACMRGELAANIGLMRALGEHPKGQSLKLDANAVAEYIGAVPNPETDKELGIVDQQGLSLARRALESRLLEAWNEFYPKLQGTPLDMATEIEKTQSNKKWQGNPSYAVIRSAYSEVATLAGAVMAAEAAVAALDLACIRLKGGEFGEEEVAIMEKHSLIFTPTADGFVFRRTLDKTRKPILEYRSKPATVAAR